MIHTFFFRKTLAFTLILTLTLGTTLIAFRSFACPISDWTYMDEDGNIQGGYSQDCKNTKESASVHAYVSKGINYKWGFIPYLLVENSNHASGIGDDAKTGYWSLDAYVEGDTDPRYKSDTFRGAFSKSHGAHNKWFFTSLGATPGNEVDASVSHDQDSSVSTATLSI